MKKIVCVLHGITDKPLLDLGGLTPLQKANTHHLDILAQRGKCLAVAPPGFGGFETALLNLLGVNDELESIAQGPLEAYSMGYVLTPDQTAFSLRFVSIGQGVVVDVSDSLLSGHEGKLFCKDLNVALGSLGCHFLYLKGSRAVLVSEHPAVKAALDQPYCNPMKAVGKTWKSLLPGKSNAELRELLEKVFLILEKHEVNELKFDLEERPANGLILYNGGKKPVLEPSSQLMDYSRVLLHTASPVSIGVGRMLKIETMKLPPEKRKYEHLINLLGKLDEIFAEKDTLVIEVDHLWNSTYKGELLEKVKGIEWLDRYVIKHLMHYCTFNNCQLTVLPLRNTEISTAELLPGDVPAVVYSQDQKANNSMVFEEKMLEKISQRIPMGELLQEKVEMQRAG